MNLTAFCLLFLTPCTGAADEREYLPQEVAVFDTRNDTGGSITFTWRRPEPSVEVYRIAVGESPGGPFYPALEVDATAVGTMADEPGTFGLSEKNKDYHFVRVKGYTLQDSTISLADNRTYYLRMEIQVGETITEIPTVFRAEAYGNWFNWSKLNNFILGSLLSVLILAFIGMARRKDLYVRRIAGLEALDEALGRATEMGKPVLFIHGLHDMESPSTIAAVNILSQVARRTAEFDTQLKVSNRYPIVMLVSQEVVKEACIDVGRPDAYNEDNIFMAAADQFSYAAALQGIMMRERPAAHIMMGYFYAESLLLAEPGSVTGAIQIAGTDAYTQLPFLVTTCDYTLMGEELYAASAYLSRDPKLLGSLKGQDVGKGFLILVILVGTLMATIGFPWLTPLFTSY